MNETTYRTAIVWCSVVVMAFLLFGNGGFRHLVEQLLEKRKLSHSLGALHAESQHLGRELDLLQKEPAYTEYLIRKNLGYGKKGDVEYRLVKTEKP
jgi:cell division protein FtsB